MARVPERIGRLLFTKAEHAQTLFADTQGETRKVTITGDQAEAIETPRVQQIHRIDDHRAVCRVLPARVGELLHRLDRELVEDLFPLGAVGGSEIAVDPLHAAIAETGDFSQKTLDDRCLGIVGIDENG